MFNDGKKSVSSILAIHEKTVTQLEARETEMGKVIDRAESEAIRLETRKNNAKFERKKAKYMVAKFKELLSFDGLEEGDD